MEDVELMLGIVNIGTEAYPIYTSKSNAEVYYRLLGHPLKCECGSDAVKSPMHSDWCPKSSTTARASTPDTSDTGTKD